MWLKTVWWRSQKRVLSHLLLTAQLCCLLAGAVIVTGSLQEQTSGLRLFNRIRGLDEAWYWTLDGEYEDADQRAADTGAFLGVGSISVSNFTWNGSMYDLQAYSAALAEEIRLPLREGQWPGAPTQSGAPGVVVDAATAENCPVGSLIEAEFRIWDSMTSYADVVRCTMEVVGVLDMQGYALDFQMGGNALRATDFLMPLERYAIIRECDLPEDVERYTMERRMLFPALAADDPALTEACAQLQALGFMMSIREARGRSREALRYELGGIVVDQALLCVYGLVALASCAFLSTVLSAKENAVYYLCGATKRRLAAIQLARYAVLYAVASVIVYALSRNGELWRWYTQPDTYWIAWACCLAVCFALLAPLSRSRVAGRTIDSLKG